MISHWKPLFLHNTIRIINFKKCKQNTITKMENKLNYKSLTTSLHANTSTFNTIHTHVKLHNRLYQSELCAFMFACYYVFLSHGQTDRQTRVRTVLRPAYGGCNKGQCSLKVSNSRQQWRINSIMQWQWNHMASPRTSEQNVIITPALTARQPKCFYVSTACGPWRTCRPAADHHAAFDHRPHLTHSQLPPIRAQFVTTDTS